MTNGTSTKETRPGFAVDSRGASTADPTLNVVALSEAATRRQDDLRAKDQEISVIQHKHEGDMAALRDKHQTIIGNMREGYQVKIQHAESARLDSIRQVDREEVAKTAVMANTAITTLAKQTADLQQTLAKQVTDTAAAQEARNSAQNSDTNKRLSALELSSSEVKGKQTVVDPQMDKLTALVETLSRSQATGSGVTSGAQYIKDEGRANINMLIGAIALVVTVGMYLFAGR